MVDRSRDWASDGDLPEPFQVDQRMVSLQIPDYRSLVGKMCQAASPCASARFGDRAARELMDRPATNKLRRRTESHIRPVRLNVVTVRLRVFPQSPGAGRSERGRAAGEALQLMSISGRTSPSAERSPRSARLPRPCLLRFPLPPLLPVFNSARIWLRVCPDPDFREALPP